MTIRKSLKLVLVSVFALVTAYLALVVFVSWQVQRDYESSKAAGLAALPPSEVGFDVVSTWQRSIFDIFPEAKGHSSPGSLLVAPSVVPLSREIDFTKPQFNTEAYDPISDNPFIAVAVDPRSTFSVDVDTAAYSNMRRFLAEGRLPPKDSLRIEEMLNYFTYDYAQPEEGHPINVLTEVAAAPWQPDHRLVRIALKTRDLDLSHRPVANLTFLIDVSGSMDEPAKLPLLKSSLKLLVDNLAATDRVAIVVYAGQEGLALPSTAGDQKVAILNAIESLSPGGSTNGASGIQLAYTLAGSTFTKGGINRVILATDGDFNVGITNEGDLVRLIREKAKSGVFLSVLGFGDGNLKDSTLEKLADEGNGNYAYIDTLSEARKVLVQEMGGTLATVAKDVKIQIEFNPAEVHAYRLIGYENRVLAHRDFNNDAKDAGDMGAGHSVTALFQVVPAGIKFDVPDVDRLKYQNPPVAGPRRAPGELLTLKIRYKKPDRNVSELMEVPVVEQNKSFNAASEDFRFAAAVASFGMILRESPHKGQATLETVIDIADRSRAKDRNGYREEFAGLARRALTLLP